MPEALMNNKTILFADNDPVLLSMYQDRLEREGFHLVCAQDGQEALDRLSAHAPDLVVLDPMLPRISGTDVLKFMQADPRLTTIPVIIFSSTPMAEVPLDDSMAQGTKHLLKSDCTFSTLLETINQTLATEPELVVVEADATPVSPSPMAAAGESAESDSQLQAANEPPGFLKQALAEVPMIREQCLAFIKAPVSADSQGHLSELQQRVHSLGVSAGQAGCPRVALLTNTFDALLAEVAAAPSGATQSALRTMVQAVDCLSGLLENDGGDTTEPILRAKVLVVDDDPVCSQVNVSSLKRANFEAVGVNDPAAALRVLEASQYDLVDLVVLDINMPGMTGFNLCEKIRSLPDYTMTPVIFVTAFSNFDNRRQSVLSGGDDFISKPVSPMELALKVTVHLIKPRVQRASIPRPETGSGAAGVSAGGLPTTSTQTSQPGYGEMQRAVRSAVQEPTTGSADIQAELLRELEAAKAAANRAQKAHAEEAARCGQLEEELAGLRRARDASGQQVTAKTQEEIKELQENLRQRTEELDRAKAAAEQQSAERARLESEWREQLDATKKATGEAETALKENTARCSQLEKELADLQQARAELQNVSATGQQVTAKAQEEIKELQEHLRQRTEELDRARAAAEQQSAERARLESEWREQLNAATAATAQAETALKERADLCNQLEKNLSGLQQSRDKLQGKLTAAQQAAAESQKYIKDLDESARQNAAELKRLQTSLEQQSAERAGAESKWRDQLAAAKKDADDQIQKVLNDWQARCNELEGELAGLRQVRDNLQGKLTAGQQAAAKAQKEIKELEETARQNSAELKTAKASLEELSAERARLESELRDQLNTAKETASEAETALKESAAQCAKLEEKLAGLGQVRDDLQAKFTAAQQAAAKSRQESKELQKRLRLRTAELKRANVRIEQQSAERTRLESEWTEQLNTATAATGQAETVLKESEARCSQLDQELAGLRQAHDELQSRFAAGQEEAARSQQHITELEERARQRTAELKRAKAGLEEQSAQRARLESEYRTLAEAKEALSLELGQLRDSHASREAELRDKNKKMVEVLRESVLLLQERIQDTEIFYTGTANPENEAPPAPDTTPAPDIPSAPDTPPASDSPPQ
jgi:DNA-binding response OmpR family regulator